MVILTKVQLFSLRYFCRVQTAARFEPLNLVTHKTSYDNLQSFLS